MSSPEEMREDDLTETVRSLGLFLSRLSSGPPLRYTSDDDDDSIETQDDVPIVETFMETPSTSWPILITKHLAAGNNLFDHIVIETWPHMQAAWRLALKRNHIDNVTLSIVLDACQATVLPRCDLVITFRQHLVHDHMWFLLAYTPLMRVMRPPCDPVEIIDVRMLDKMLSPALVDAMYLGKPFYKSLKHTPFEPTAKEQALLTTQPQTCSVCLDHDSNEPMGVLRPCHHVYHEACVSEWLKRNTTCPQCRNETNLVITNRPIHVHTRELANIYVDYVSAVVRKALIRPTNVIILCKTDLLVRAHPYMDCIRASDKDPYIPPNINVLQTPTRSRYELFVWPTTVFLCDGISIDNVRRFIWWYSYRRYHTCNIGLNKITLF